MVGPAMYESERRRRELAVRVDVLRAVHQRDEERGAGEVEEDGERSDGERDREQLPDGQRSQPPGERNRRQRGRAQDVRDDHVAPAVRAPVDPDACGQREEQVRKPRERGEDPDLERRGVERENRRQRDRERADLVSEDGDRLPDPEPHEERLPG